MPCSSNIDLPLPVLLDSPSSTLFLVLPDGFSPACPPVSFFSVNVKTFFVLPFDTALRSSADSGCCGTSSVDIMSLFQQSLMPAQIYLSDRQGFLEHLVQRINEDIDRTQ
uniref:Uncharacterized protein n=1 Tax=Glossina palpalis gambiensis TaxID=67801 RepID=A0A1B0BA33_9MUSC